MIWKTGWTSEEYHQAPNVLVERMLMMMMAESVAVSGVVDDDEDDPTPDLPTVEAPADTEFNLALFSTVE